MSPIAALIEFPEVNPIALAGLCVVALSLLFGLFSNYYIKRFQHNKHKSKLQWEGVHDIFDDKKLSHDEINLIEKVIIQHEVENPLRAVSTRDGFGKCVDSAMNMVSEQQDYKTYRDMGIRLRDIRNALGLDYIPVGKPIFSTREIHIGQLLNIASDDDQKAVWYDMMVQDVDEAFLYISPVKNAISPSYEDGAIITCTLWRDEDARYTFDSKIMRHDDVHAKWRINHNTEKMERTQDREHFRLRFEQSVTVGILNASVDEDTDNLKQRQSITKLRGKITSLSAGGCAIVFQQAIAKNVYLKLGISLPGESPITLVGKIVNTSNISGGRTLIRTQFISTSEDERDIITRHLLQKQQETLPRD